MLASVVFIISLLLQGQITGYLDNFSFIVFLGISEAVIHLEGINNRHHLLRDRKSQEGHIDLFVVQPYAVPFFDIDGQALVGCVGVRGRHRTGCHGKISRVLGLLGVATRSCAERGRELAVQGGAFVRLVHALGIVLMQIVIEKIRTKLHLLEPILFSSNGRFHLQLHGREKRLEAERNLHVTGICGRDLRRSVHIRVRHIRKVLYHVSGLFLPQIFLIAGNTAGNAYRRRCS